MAARQLSSRATNLDLPAVFDSTMSCFQLFNAIAPTMRVSRALDAMNLLFWPDFFVL